MGVRPEMFQKSANMMHQIWFCFYFLAAGGTIGTKLALRDNESQQGNAMIAKIISMLGDATDRNRLELY